MVNKEDGTNGEVLKLLNPMWVNHHFHEKFVVIVVAYAKNSHAWVTAPVGSLRGGRKDAQSPGKCIVLGVICHYLQHDQEN